MGVTKWPTQACTIPGIAALVAQALLPTRRWCHCSCRCRCCASVIAIVICAGIFTIIALALCTGTIARVPCCAGILTPPANAHGLSIEELWHAASPLSSPPVYVCGFSTEENDLLPLAQQSKAASTPTWPYRGCEGSKKRLSQVKIEFGNVGLSWQGGGWNIVWSSMYS
jgi:hypothetical protein